MEVLAETDDPGRLIAALEGNLWSAWSTLGLGDDCAFHTKRGALMVETPIRAFPYNMVQHFEGGDDPEGRVDHVVLHFGRRGVPFLWLITPTSRPEGLASLLEAKGMALIESLSGMAAPLRQVVEARTALEADVTISEATESDLEELYSFISSRRDVPDRDREAACAVYENFRFGREGARARFWIARDGGRVVGKCLLHCGAGVAGIHGVATKPEARGRGIARALTVEALSSAVEDGYEVGVPHSSQMAVALYQGLGFREVADFALYGPPDGFHV